MKTSPAQGTHNDKAREQPPQYEGQIAAQALDRLRLERNAKKLSG